MTGKHKHNKACRIYWVVTTNKEQVSTQRYIIVTVTRGDNIYTFSDIELGSTILLLDPSIEIQTNNAHKHTNKFSVARLRKLKILMNESPA